MVRHVPMRHVPTAAAIVLLAVSVAAAEPTAFIRIGKDRATRGEPIDIEVVVKGGKPGGTDMEGVKKNFDVQSRGESRQVRTVTSGSRMETVEEYVYAYSVTPKKTGTSTIPAIPVTVDGKVFTTRPVEVTVVEGTNIEFSVNLTKNMCYVGEQIPITVRIVGNMPIRKLVNIQIPFRHDDRFFVWYGEDGNLEFAETDELVGERSVKVYTAAAIVIPKQAGRFVMERPGVTCYVQTGWRMVRGFFGGQSRQAKYGYRTAFSPTVSLTVKEPPPAGKPADFCGIVGRPNVTAVARPTNVSVGQPIDYAVSFSGLPYMGGIAPLEVGTRKRFADRFKIQEDGVAGNLEEGVMTFRRTLRALNDKVTEIPALRVSYLDPATGRYEHVATRAIPITVNPTRVVGFDDGMGAPTSTGKFEVETKVTGIAGNEIGMDVIQDEYFAAVSALKKPGWLSALVIPLLVWVTVLARVKTSDRRMQDEAGEKARRAYRSARKAIRALRREEGTPDFDDRLIRTVFCYVGERLRKNPAGLTPSESRDLLLGASVPEDTVREVESLLGDLEGARFGGMAELSREELLAKAEQLLKEMEKAL